MESHRDIKTWKLKLMHFVSNLKPVLGLMYVILRNVASGSIWPMPFHLSHSGGVLRQRRSRDDGGGVSEEEAPLGSKPLRRPVRKVSQKFPGENSHFLGENSNFPGPFDKILAGNSKLNLAGTT